MFRRSFFLKARIVETFVSNRVPPTLKTTLILIFFLLTRGMKRTHDELVQKASRWDKAKNIFDEGARLQAFFVEGKKKKTIQEQELKALDSEISALNGKEDLLKRCQQELSFKLCKIMDSTPLSEFELIVGLKKNIDFLLSESQKLHKAQKNRAEKLEQLNETKIGVSYMEMRLEQIETEFEQIFRK
jgi:hypothetical protein